MNSTQVATLSCKAGTVLPWAAVDSMGIDSLNVWVHAQGKRFPWAVYPRVQVLNAVVLRDVVSRLAGRPVG